MSGLRAGIVVFTVKGAISRVIYADGRVGLTTQSNHLCLQIHEVSRCNQARLRSDTLTICKTRAVVRSIIKVDEDQARDGALERRQRLPRAAVHGKICQIPVLPLKQKARAREKRERLKKKD